MVPSVPFFLLEENFSIQIIYFQLLSENHFLSHEERNYELNVSYRKIFVFLLSLIIWVEYKDATWCFLPFEILQVLLVRQNFAAKRLASSKHDKQEIKWIKTDKMFNAGCCDSSIWDLEKKVQWNYFNSFISKYKKITLSRLSCGIWELLLMLLIEKSFFLIPDSEYVSGSFLLW